MIDRKALWAVRESGLPTVMKPCVDCSGARHRPSRKFRVNANGKLLDVWLLLRCTACGRTSKVPVHERVHVQSLERTRRVAYEISDPAVVLELTMSASLAAKNGYRLDWTGTRELETDTSFYSPCDPASLRVLISFELPAPFRVERLLMLGLVGQQHLVMLGGVRRDVRRLPRDHRLVTTRMDHTAAAPPSVGDIDPAAWLERFDDMFGRVLTPAFYRREPRLRAQSYLLGLVSGLERKNGWTLAEFAGDATPDGMQPLLSAARWDQDAVRDALGRYVAAELGDPSGVLIADETGFEKSGT